MATKNNKDNNKKAGTKKSSAKKNRLSDIEITKADKSLFKFIGKHESYGGNPNTLYGGYKKKPEKPITKMTLKEVYELQEDMKNSGSSAVGAHQFLQHVLQEEAKAAGLTGDELFDHDLQNKLMKHRLIRVRNYDQFLEGKIKPDQFALNLSQEFASMPVPFDTKGHKRPVKAGESYYAGDEVGNKSGTDHKTILATLEGVKGIYDNSDAIAGDVSVNPESILENSVLNDNQKEELLKINESQGLESATANTVQQGQSLLQEIGYMGSLLPDDIVDQDLKKKDQKNSKQQVVKPRGYQQGMFALNSEQLLADSDTAYNDGGMINHEEVGGLTEYNEGGSHEQNPQGGIPVGQNPQGGRNLVEQGETRHGDYIFSNHYELSEDDAKRFNLDPKFAGKSMSDVSKLINDEIEKRPYDSLTKKTANGNLNKLMLVQETIKQEEQMQQAEANPEMNQMQPQAQPGDESFNPGGLMALLGGGAGAGAGAAASSAGAGLGAGMGGGLMGGVSAGMAQGATQAAQSGQGLQGLLGKAGGAAGIAGDALMLANFAKNAFGKTGIDTSGTAGRQAQVKNAGFDAAAQGAQGAMAGMKYGPAGAIIGAGLGVGSSLMGSEKKRNDIAEGNRNASYIANNEYHSTFDKGGSLLDNYLHSGGNIQPHMHPHNPSQTSGGSFPTEMTPEQQAQELMFNRGVGYDNKLLPFGLKTPDFNPAGYNTQPQYSNPSVRDVRTANEEPQYPKPEARLGLQGNESWEAAKELQLTQAGNVQPKMADMSGRPLRQAGTLFDDQFSQPNEYQPGANQPNVSSDGDYYFNDPDNLLSGQAQAQSILEGYEKDASANDPNLPGNTTVPTDQTSWLDKYLNLSQHENHAQSLEDNEMPESVTLESLLNSSSGNADGTGTSDDENSGGLRGASPIEHLRYAGMLGNIGQYMNAPDAMMEKYDRLDSRYNPDYVDERGLQNRVADSAANTRRSLNNAYGGSAAGVRAGLLASQANEGRALSDAMMRAEEQNRAENARGQQFNLGVDRMNQQIDMRETIANTQNKTAAEDYKRALMQTILSDASDIGREQYDRRVLQNMTGGYDADGRKKGRFTQFGDTENKDQNMLSIATAWFNRNKR